MDAIKVFLSISATIAGFLVLLAVPYNGFFADSIGQFVVGVILLAAGLTYLWKRSGLGRQKRST